MSSQPKLIEFLLEPINLMIQLSITTLSLKRSGNSCAPFFWTQLRSIHSLNCTKVCHIHWAGPLYLATALWKRPWVNSLMTICILLQNIDGLQVPTNAILAAIDVEALYSSILHDKGLACILQVLSEKSRFECKFNNFIIDALEFVLCRNYFVFNSSHFLQVQAIVMGTCCASSYVNLYLWEWERMIKRLGWC